jgi:hypothetical protein
MHRHHVIPEHRGGEDSESNLTPPISVTCHAMFHWCEWQRTGNKYDKIAWKTLTGQIGKEEARISANKEWHKRSLKDGTHPFLVKNRNWNIFEANKKAAITQIKNGTLSLLNLDLSSISKKAQKERVNQGTHHFLRGNETWDRSRVAKETAKKRIENKTLPLLSCNRDWDYSEISKKARQNMSKQSLERMIRNQTINRRINSGWTNLNLEFINSIKESSSNKIFKNCQEKFNWPNSRGVIQNILKAIESEGVENLLDRNFFGTKT